MTGSDEPMSPEVKRIWDKVSALCCDARLCFRVPTRAVDDQYLEGRISAFEQVMDIIALPDSEEDCGLGECECCHHPYDKELDGFKHCPRCKVWIG
ncbi:MAG: hypothetical protein E7Z63_06130 [Thermoplasmata archaeon]|nr:hypothetical protein [Thermoplasmata archaeon]